MSKEISTSEIKEISSDLLSEGRPHEKWKINTITIDGDTLHAVISMVSTYISPTDDKGFHLSVFTTLEFLSQLKVIYYHHTSGLDKKTQEAWMIESHVRCKSSIRDADKINVTMKVLKARNVGGRIYGITQSTVTDDLGGRFEVTLKSLLS
ncbi:MAG: hypothetical protein V4727_04935 [Verrucomicrobiota bacterium]